MTATTTATNHNDLVINSFPATKALEIVQSKAVSGRARNNSFESKLACDLFTLHFEDDVTSFPTIQWDNDDSDSDSVRSLESWSSFLNEADSSPSLGKRGRSESRRLVRSKKIKSDLHSLAFSLSS